MHPEAKAEKAVAWFVPNPTDNWGPKPRAGRPAKKHPRYLSSACLFVVLTTSVACVLSRDESAPKSRKRLRLRNLVCSRWKKEGVCPRGSDCNFLHFNNDDEGELEKLVDAHMRHLEELAATGDKPGVSCSWVSFSIGSMY